MFPHIAASLSRRVVALGAGIAHCLTLSACDFPDLNFFGGSDAKETTATVINQTPSEQGAESAGAQNSKDSDEKRSSGDESDGEGSARGGDSRSGDSATKTRAKGPDVHMDFEDMSDEDFFGYPWGFDKESWQPSTEEMAALLDGLEIGDTITLGGQQITIDLIGSGYMVSIGGSNVPVPDHLGSNLVMSAFPPDTHAGFVYLRHVLPITLEVPATSGSGTEKFRCVLLEDRSIQCSNGKGIKYYIY